TGLELGLAAVTEAHRGDYTVKLKEDHERSTFEVIDDVRAKVTQQEPELKTEFPQLLSDMINDLSNAPEPIQIKLFAEDPAVVANDRAYIIRVRFPQQNRASIREMSNTLLVSSSGHTATLGSLATLVELPGQTEIRRENLQRNLTVTGELEERDLGSTMADIQKAIADLHLPGKIRVEYGGQYQEQQRSFRELVMVLVLAVVLVFLVLLFEF